MPAKWSGSSLYTAQCHHNLLLFFAPQKKFCCENKTKRFAKIAHTNKNEIKLVFSRHKYAKVATWKSDNVLLTDSNVNKCLKHFISLMKVNCEYENMWLKLWNCWVKVNLPELICKKGFFLCVHCVMVKDMGNYDTQHAHLIQIGWAWRVHKLFNTYFMFLLSVVSSDVRCYWWLFAGGTTIKHLRFKW